MMLGRNATLTMKKTEVPEYLPISPLALPCPFCHAKPNEIWPKCLWRPFELVHVARVKAAAKLDKARKNGKK